MPFALATHETQCAQTVCFVTDEDLRGRNVLHIDCIATCSLGTYNYHLFTLHRSMSLYQIMNNCVLIGPATCPSCMVQTETLWSYYNIIYSKLALALLHVLLDQEPCMLFLKDD